MATCTAELIFGKAHQNDSGINFNHRLTLYEGDRATLVLERKPTPFDAGELIDRWTPHVDRVLEDSLVMLAGFCTGNDSVKKLIAEISSGREDKNEILTLYDVDEELMGRLYAAARETFKLQKYQGENRRGSDRWKVVACIFEGSHLVHSLKKLLAYDIDIEVCQSVFQSEYSPWNEKINVRGEI